MELMIQCLDGFIGEEEWRMGFWVSGDYDLG